MVVVVSEKKGKPPRSGMRGTQLAAWRFEAVVIASLQGTITYPTWGSSENHRLKSALVGRGYVISQEGIGHTSEALKNQVTFDVRWIFRYQRFCSIAHLSHLREKTGRLGCNGDSATHLYMLCI